MSAIGRVPSIRRFRRVIGCLVIGVLSVFLVACDELPFGDPYHPMGIQRVDDKYYLVSAVCKFSPSRIETINVHTDLMDEGYEEYDELWELRADAESDVFYEWPSMFRVQLGEPIDGMTAKTPPKDGFASPELHGYVLTQDDQWQLAQVDISKIKDGEIMAHGKIVDVDWLYRQGGRADRPK